jgi:hypothetical protein
LFFISSLSFYVLRKSLSFNFTSKLKLISGYSDDYVHRRFRFPDVRRGTVYLFRFEQPPKGNYSSGIDSLSRWFARDKYPSGASTVLSGSEPGEQVTVASMAQSYYLLHKFDMRFIIKLRYSVDEIELQIYTINWLCGAAYHLTSCVCQAVQNYKWPVFVYPRMRIGFLAIGANS